MTTIDERLRALGDALDLDDPGDELVATVMARLDEPVVVEHRMTVLRVAAAVVLVLAVVVAAVPSSRRAVADWLGFDGVRIERRPDVSVPARPDPVVDGAGGDDGSIGTVVEVDGRDVLVSELAGTLDTPAIGKIATDGTNVSQVGVGGAFALWIDGAPHEVSFFGPDGEFVFERIAGNTLLWQDGDVIRRLEGFATVDDAIDYAESLDDG